MPKIDFNVPFIDETGQAVRKPKIDKSKTRVGQNGQLFNIPVTDAEGFVEYEDVLLKDILATAINSNVEGDDKMTYPERVLRGKLARKLSDSSKGSLKNYSTEQLLMIKDTVTRAQGSPALAAQIEELIEGNSEELAETPKLTAAV